MESWFGSAGISRIHANAECNRLGGIRSQSSGCARVFPISFGTLVLGRESLLYDKHSVSHSCLICFWPCLLVTSFRPYSCLNIYIYPALLAINVFPALFVFHGFLSPCPSSAVSSSRMRFQGFRVRTARAWALFRCTSCCAPCSDCSIRPRAAASSRARALSSALAHLYIP